MDMHRSHQNVVFLFIATLLQSLASDFTLKIGSPLRAILGLIAPV